MSWNNSSFPNNRKSKEWHRELSKQSNNQAWLKMPSQEQPQQPVQQLAMLQKIKQQVRQLELQQLAVKLVVQLVQLNQLVSLLEKRNDNCKY
jgi:hypothetical protein